MLILTRRPGETLTIGEEVRVTVLGVKGAQIRLGIDAPKTVGVHREEIFLRIQRDAEQKLLDAQPQQATGTDDTAPPPSSVVYLTRKD